MALVESLLTAIVRADGDALVMHVGEKPYVVASAGPIELATHGLNLQAMVGMVAQLLPPELQRALSEFGAVEHELPARPAASGDRFTVVVARGGEDIWIEIRRHRRPRAAAAVSEITHETGVQTSGAPLVEQPPSHETDVVGATEHAQHVENDSTHSAVSAAAAPPTDDTFAAPSEPPVEQGPTEMPEEMFNPASIETAAAPQEVMYESEHERPEAPAAVSASEFPPAQAAERHTAPAPVDPTSAAAVLPMPRNFRGEVPPPTVLREVSGPSEIQRLLDIASARGATALYLTTNAAPFLRVDDDVRPLEGELPMSATAVEFAVVEFMPAAHAEAMRRGEPTEWVTDVVGVGRVRASTFRDHRGPGAMFQLVSLRPLTAESLGLTTEMQALASESEGLVLVASPPGGGKTTVVGALVDLVNRRRPGYVITLERQIRVVHDHRAALVSQREVSGSAEGTLAAARAALRENPDVLVIDDMASPEVVDVALDAAGSGLLVIASMTAPSTTAALERLRDFFPVERRGAVQSRLAEAVRGAIAQVLLRPAGGRRLPARELLLPTAAVIDVLADGQLHDLPGAIESGRPHGLVTLTETLVRLVRSGVIDVREAHRKAGDRAALLAALKRENVDTSFVERIA